MQGTPFRTRLADTVAARRHASRTAALERAPRAELDRLRGERLDALVRHARRASPFYRDALAGLPGETVRPTDLPRLDKATLMERYDEIVTDPALRRDALLAHVEALEDDALYAGRFRVMATSGSSGRKALFAYDRDAWRRLVGACVMRSNDWAGLRPGLPRPRIAVVGPSRAVHMSARMGRTVDVGVFDVLPVPATLPLDRIVEALNAFRPDRLQSFPTVGALLAQEQLAGRLRIAPRVVTTSSEARTPEATAVMAEAWGTPPRDMYAMTEAGAVALECEHGSLHVLEDTVDLEVVDAEGRPVPDGETGDAVLVTSLVNHAQPTLRLEVSDRVAFEPGPCPCGRTWRRLRPVEGRADDVLHLSGRDGRPVAVHPLHFTPVARAKEVREFQIVGRGDEITVRVVPFPGTDVDAAARRMTAELTTGLGALGAAGPRVRVEAVDALPRDDGAMGKLKLVVREEPAAAPA